MQNFKIIVSEGDARMTRTRRYTGDDLWNILEKDKKIGTRMELINGDLVALPVNDTHSAIVGRLTRLLRDYVTTYKLGRVAVATGYTRARDKHNVRFPDVSFVSYERTLPVTKGGFVPYMPDLAVQVKSEHITTIEIAERGIYYLKNGSGLVWIVHPDQQNVDVLSRSGRRNFRVYKVKGDNTLVGGDVLPGLALAVNDIFRDQPPTTTIAADSKPRQV